MPLIRWNRCAFIASQLFGATEVESLAVALQKAVLVAVAPCLRIEAEALVEGHCLGKVPDREDGVPRARVGMAEG